jgi:hypothetical protein
MLRGRRVSGCPVGGGQADTPLGTMSLTGGHALWKRRTRKEPRRGGTEDEGGYYVQCQQNTRELEEAAFSYGRRLGVHGYSS